MMDLIGMDGYGWVIMVLQFLALEGTALFNKKKGDTWSEVVRFVFGFSKRSQAQGWGMRARRGSFYAIMAWFTAHIGFGI